MAEIPSSSPASRQRRRAGSWQAQGAWLIPVLSVACCLALWEVAVRTLDVPIYLIPAPSLIASKLVAAYPLFLQETLHSVVAIIIGFAMAVVVGIPAATLMIYSE